MKTIDITKKEEEIKKLIGMVDYVLSEKNTNLTKEFETGLVLYSSMQKEDFFSQKSFEKNMEALLGMTAEDILSDIKKYVCENMTIEKAVLVNEKYPTGLPEFNVWLYDIIMRNKDIDGYVLKNLQYIQDYIEYAIKDHIKGDITLYFLNKTDRSMDLTMPLRNATVMSMLKNSDGIFSAKKPDTEKYDGYSLLYLYDMYMDNKYGKDADLILFAYIKKLKSDCDMITNPNDRLLFFSMRIDGLEDDLKIESEENFISLNVFSSLKNEIKNFIITINKK